MSTHSSVFSSILSILVTLIFISFTIISGKELLERKDPVSFTTTRYQNDFGTVRLDQSGMFHYFMIKNYDQTPIPIDETYFSLRGYRYTFSYEGRKNLVEYEYGLCKFEIDARGIEYLIANRTSFEHSYCIRKASNLEKNKTYYKNTTDNSFPYPYLSLRIDDAVNYDTFSIFSLELNECANTTTFNKCKPKEEIQNSLKRNVYFELDYIDNNFDVSDYDNPIIRYFLIETGDLSPGKLSKNDFNIFPATVTTSDNLLFDLPNRVPSYKQLNSEKVNLDQVSTEVLQCTFWPKTQGTIYTRRYKRLQDLFAYVGGFFSFLLQCSLVLNYFPQKYQILLDTIRIFKHNNLKKASQEKGEVNDNSKLTTVLSKMNIKSKDSNGKMRRADSIRTINHSQIKDKSSDIVTTDLNLNLGICYKELFKEEYKNMLSYVWRSAFCFLKNEQKLQDEILLIRKILLSEESIIKSIIDVAKIKNYVLSLNQKNIVNSKIIFAHDIVLGE